VPSGLLVDADRDLVAAKASSAWIDKEFVEILILLAILSPFVVVGCLKGRYALSIVGALVRGGEEYLRGRGARRVTALVAIEDGAAAAFWESVGYPRDPAMGRHVRNL
jgi:hypothetical protein